MIVIFILKFIFIYISLIYRNNKVLSSLNLTSTDANSYVDPNLDPSGIAVVPVSEGTVIVDEVPKTVAVLIPELNHPVIHSVTLPITSHTLPVTVPLYNGISQSPVSQKPGVLDVTSGNELSEVTVVPQSLPDSEELDLTYIFTPVVNPASKTPLSPTHSQYMDLKNKKNKTNDQTQSTQPTSTKFTVEEVYAGPARAGQTIEYEDSDDEFEETEVHKVVTELGVKVDTLEHRMNAAEDNIDMLKKLVNYQHNIMEFSNMLKKAGPTTPEFGHRLFESYKFKPATYKESKELDVTEHPSDIKLYTVDSTDVTKTVELETSKYTVKQVGETIQYEWESEVKCTWITFEGKTVWSHREGEYPLGVEYYPEDDKVVVDFNEEIIMYIKKGDLNQPTETRTSVDIPLGHLDDSEDETTDDSVQSVQSPISETYASGYATTSITQVENVFTV